MPWCDGCAKYWTPNSVATDGACPSCGVVLATARQLRSEAHADTAEKVPWHFKLMLIALAIYLGWRAVQGIAWVVHKL